MLKYLAIVMGALVSAAAQVSLKKSSSFMNWSRGWLLFLLVSCILYGISLLIYLYLLRLYPISKIYPVTTLTVILLVTLYGFFMGEGISSRHIIGLALGAGSIILLLV
jgi:drug/metabolite transporter (DMT)-like permease